MAMKPYTYTRNNKTWPLDVETYQTPAVTVIQTTVLGDPRFLVKTLDSEGRTYHIDIEGKSVLFGATEADGYQHPANIPQEEFEKIKRELEALPPRIRKNISHFLK